MAKDAYYFPHDYYARNDPKLQRLLMDFGLAGIGAYWCIVEILYENGGICRKCDTRAIAFGLHCDESLVASILENYDLFEKTAEGDYFSASANDRIARRAEVAEKRSAAGRKGNEVRWKNGSIANASESVANATENHRKTSQGKERKTARDIDIAKSKDIDLSFIDEELQVLFKEFLSMRKRIGHPLKTRRGIEARYTTLSQLSGGDISLAKKIIQQSLDKEWQDFYELKDNSNGNGTINQRTHRGSNSGYVPDYSNTKF